jgi:hypothetical protein
MAREARAPALSFMHASGYPGTGSDERARAFFLPFESTRRLRCKREPSALLLFERESALMVPLFPSAVVQKHNAS